MRRITSMLSEVRKLQLAASHQRGSWQGDLNVRLREVDDMYRLMDSELSGIRSMDQASTKMGEVMTSADFAFAIQEFIQRQMIPGYQEKRFDFEALVKSETTPNYLPVTRYQRRAGLDDLEYVGEKGSGRAGHTVDATKRQFRVFRFEKDFDFSMEALINDDLGYFNDMSMDMGRAARRSLEKYVSRMYTNAVSTARLIALGALYSIAGRLTSARISEARMAFNQRLDDRGQPISATLKYIVHHSGLVDVVRVIRQSQLVPELATNAQNVISGDFTPIEDPYLVGTAPNLPWYAFTDPGISGIVALILARRQGMPAPMLLRKRSDIEQITSLLGSGSDVPPVMGDFATGNVTVKVTDEWGTYIDAVEGNLFDFRGAFYSSGTAA